MERRSRTRVVTLRNGGKAALAFALLFIVLTVASEMHRPKRGEYGRLVSSETPKSETITKQVQVVTEAPVERQPAETTALVDASATTPQQPRLTSGERVTIVGGPDGVSVQRGANDAPARHLRGGFSRQ